MTQTAASIDPVEIERFSALAAEWWDPQGKFRPLHKFNPVRLGFLRDRIAGHFGRDTAGEAPLQGLRLLDIGCGGGLVSEPMARLGASVTGADAGERNIGIARQPPRAVLRLIIAVPAPAPSRTARWRWRWSNMWPTSMASLSPADRW
jgi:2-polyprenyl-3-methyl-5-hydroxy-6-metoxy-1,4-benzoquinol methylase